MIPNVLNHKAGGMTMEKKDTFETFSSSLLSRRTMNKMVRPLRILFGLTLSCTGFLQISNNPLPGYGVALVGSVLILEGITRFR